MILRRWLSILFSLSLGGCMVGPDYHAPETTISSDWESLSDAISFVSEEEPPIDWWNTFDDPLLESYIE